MALARLALGNLYRRGSALGLPLSTSSVRSLPASGGGGRQNSKWNDESIVKRFMSTSSSGGGGKSESKVVTVKDQGGGVKKRLSRLLPWRRRRRSPGLWRRDTDHDFFNGGIGNALIQAASNMDQLFEHISPSNLFGHIKEKDDHYKMRFEVPGLTKDDLTITVDDGVLTIQGEHKEEEEEGSDDEFWSARSYGYYNTSLALPDDAKEDEIKAELKNGVLFVTIPKSEKPKKDVKEVKIH